MPEIVIDPRFSGPPGSANGGYTCGRVAAYADGPAEVTLRLPPPLGVPMAVDADDGSVRVLDGERLVAEAAPGAVDLVPPGPVGLDTAREASARYSGHEIHPFPGCFVCGPDRADGLRIFPGQVAGVVAAPWTPAADLADGSAVRREFVWAALDCAGAWSLDISPQRLMVLGRLAARVDAPVAVGEPHVVVAWPLGVDGRKSYAGTALYSASGDLLAVARATWITIG